MLKAKIVEFFVKYFPLVVTITKSTKISPYFILSVSALETGYGCSRPGVTIPPRLSVINFQVYSFLREKLSAVKLNLFLLFSHFLAGFHLRNIVYYEEQMKGFLNLFLIILIHSIASAQPADPLAFNLSDCSRISVPYRLCSAGLSYRNVTYLADMDNAGKHEFVFKPPESIGIKSG